MSQSLYARSAGGWMPVRWLRVTVSMVAAAAAAAAGCSADVARFDSASFNLNDEPGSTAPPVPQRPVYSGSDGVTRNLAQSQPVGPHGATNRLPPLSDRSRGIEREDLPSAGYGNDAEYGSAAPLPTAVNGFSQSPRGSERERAAIKPAPIAGGETIEVQPGDTLYGLSRRHSVSLSELMAVNNLSKPMIKPGQRLVLPAAGAERPSAERPSRFAALQRDTMSDASPPPSMPAPRVQPSFDSPTASPDTLDRYGGSYTVKAGDSLYNIARSYKVPFTQLQQVNGITDVRKVRPGTVLRVPGAQPSAVETIAEAPAAEAKTEQQTAPAFAPADRDGQAVSVGPPEAPSSSASPRILNENKRVAARTDTATDASPPLQGDTAKLRWPATGKIIAGFGPRPDGTNNDGINLSVPLGTDVKAAEGGVVAYAGSELKGYGNLVLIRHENGWVTAYAHNEELMVSRGDTVRRGQVIAKAGKSGTVDQPQVHFELRQDAKPVDPTPFMERM